MSNALETLPTAESIARIQERFVLLDTRFDSLVGSFQPESATRIQKATDVFDVPLNQGQVELYLEQIGKMQDTHWMVLIGIFAVIVTFFLIVQGLAIYRNSVDKEFKDSLNLLQENLNKQSSAIDIKFATMKSQNLTLRQALAKQTEQALKSSESKTQDLLEHVKKEVKVLKKDLNEELNQTRSKLAASISTIHFYNYVDNSVDGNFDNAFVAITEVFNNLLLDYRPDMAKYYLKMLLGDITKDLEIFYVYHDNLLEVLESLESEDKNLISIIEQIRFALDKFVKVQGEV